MRIPTPNTVRTVFVTPKKSALEGFLLRIIPFFDKKVYYQSLFSFFHGVSSKEEVKEKISKYIPLYPSKFGDLLVKYAPLKNYFKQENRPDLLVLWKKFAEVSPKVCLLVAESGMGKTLLFQKVFIELAKKYPNYHLAFVYCGLDTDQQIAQVKEQSKTKEQETIIFIDAFDEDYKARSQDHIARFKEIILELQNFKKIFISARIQLFEKDAQVPTGIGKMNFIRVEIGKMNKPSIEKFIKIQFPDKVTQAKALKMVSGKEESLFYRPLILSYLDFLFAAEKPFYFLAQIYTQIVKEWAERESRVLNPNAINKEELLSITENLLKQDAQKLALHLYEKGQDGWNADELKTLSQMKKNATSRSFFTRSEKDDKYSFAHKAFYDYFLVLNLLDSSIREEGFIEKPSNADTVQLYQELLTEKADSTRKKVINFLQIEQHEWDFDAALNELLQLIPNLAIRSLLIKYKDQFQDFKAKKYWYEIVGYLYSLCNEEEQKHYVFADYQLFKAWANRSDDSQTVPITQSLYTKQFALEYAFEKLFFQKDKKPIQTLSVVADPANRLGFGEMLAFVFANNAYCQQSFTQLTQLDLDELNISDISFLADFQKLQVLSLNNNQISELSQVKEMLELPYLEKLYAYDNPFLANRSALDTDKELQSLIDLSKADNCLRPLRKHLLFPPPMVEVEGGSFYMGQPDPNIILYNDGQTILKSDNEQPVHEVSLDSFAIGKYPITLGDFRTFMEENEENYQTDAEKEGWIYFWNEQTREVEKKEGLNWQYNAKGELQTNDRHPVIYVSWNDAKKYCEWLSKKTGKIVRLPTEAEWEYAAKGGRKSKNYKYAGSNELDEVAWYRANSKGQTQPVGQKKPNELGIYDMSGNVWEWCSDWYGAYSASAQTNPKGADLGSYRVYRGGSWGNDPENCRVANRSGNTPANRRNILGFRLVISL